MPGVHYAENALAALCVADYLGVSFQDYCAALRSFQGIDRRFSVRGEAGGVAGRRRLRTSSDGAGGDGRRRRGFTGAARSWPSSRTVTRVRAICWPFFAPTLSGADSLYSRTSTPPANADPGRLDGDGC